MSEASFPHFSELPNYLQMAVWDYAIKDALAEQPTEGPSPPLSFYFMVQPWSVGTGRPPAAHVILLAPKITALYTRSTVFVHPLWYREYARNVLTACCSSRLLVLERAYNILVKIEPLDNLQRLLQRVLEDIMWDLHGRLSRSRGRVPTA